MIERTLIELCDNDGCHLVLTTGGTGPAPRDVTPEATLAVGAQGAARLRRADAAGQPAVRADRDPVAPGRRRSAATRLILNLPGQPKAIKETLDGVFAAVPYCIDLIGGPYLETHDAVCKAFRPKSAIRPPA